MKTEIQRNEILEKFRNFFIQSGQTTDEATQNMADLEGMNDKKLLIMLKAFQL